MRKLLLILIFISISSLLLSQPIYYPDEWCSNRPPILGSGAIWGHASTVLGDTIYAAGGSTDGNSSQVFFQYSISGNVWKLGPSLPAPKTSGDLVACGGKIYYVGGGTVVGIGTSVQYVYNPSTGTWTTIPNIPNPVTGCVGESYRDSMIYVMAGGWGTYNTQVQVYLVNSNTWTNASSIPVGGGRRSFAGGLTQNKLFVAGGYSGVFRNDLLIGTINQSDPLDITWDVGPSMAQNTSRPGGTAILNKFYVVIGEVSSNYGSDSIGVYDLGTNSWTYYTGKPVDGSNYWGVISASITNCAGKTGVKIWVPGGQIGTISTRPLLTFADTCITNCFVVTGIESNVTVIPKTYILHQNYPNPFNPSTSISFELPRTEKATITITDITGKELAILTDGLRASGRHRIFFNAVNFASGVYYYTLKTDNYSETKKMVLIK
jgi:hypothetical protein